MSALRKYHTEISALLLFICCILVVTNLVKYGLLTKATIEQNKDVIQAIGSLLSSMVLLFAAIASYYRFFRGRTLSVVADLLLNVDIYETGHNFILHVLDIELINKGAFPIWEPIPTIIAYQHETQDISSPTNVELWNPSNPDKNIKNVKVVFPQENQQFVAFHRVPHGVWAITYVVRVQSTNTTWTKAITVSNKIQRKNRDAIKS